MRMNEIVYEGRAPIDAYGAGGFRISGAQRPGSLLLLPERAVGWGVREPGRIGPETLAPVLAAAAEIDVLLVGMGPEIAPLPRPAREALEAAGLGVEAMATASACRTYNVLLAEGRRVAAALIAV